MCIPLESSSYKMPERKDSLFWAIATTCYALVVVLSAIRIYVHHSYPIFYTEEEIPDMAGELLQAVNFLNL